MLVRQQINDGQTNKIQQIHRHASDESKQHMHVIIKIKQALFGDIKYECDKILLNEKKSFEPKNRDET